MNRKSFLALLIAAFLFVSQPIAAKAPVEEDGTQAIAAGANTIQLTGAHQHIIVWTSSSASNVGLSFNHGVVATTSSQILYGGAGLAYGLCPNSVATDQVNYYGYGTTGNINWIAF